MKTAWCRWKLWYVPKFTAASCGTPCDSMASCQSPHSINCYNSLTQIICWRHCAVVLSFLVIVNLSFMCHGQMLHYYLHVHQVNEWTMEWTAEIMFSFDVCLSICESVCSGTVMHIARNRLELQISASVSFHFDFMALYKSSSSSYYYCYFKFDMQVPMGSPDMTLLNFGCGQRHVTLIIIIFICSNLHKAITTCKYNKRANFRLLNANRSKRVKDTDLRFDVHLSRDSLNISYYIFFEMGVWLGSHNP